MKKSALSLAIAGIIIIALSGCEELLDKVGITISSDYTNIDFTVNPDNAGTYTEKIEVIDSNLDSLIEAEGQNVGELNSVKIKDAMILVLGEGNLDPFESFLLTIEAPGKAVVKIAEVTSVGLGLKEIPMIKEEVDLSDYLKSDQYTIKVKTVLDQDLETHMNMRARVRYDIKVGL
ncbi:MAG: hypothetical protein JXR41_04115 [Bacteroidales bacterium]|nr:hypothetical protein [Bacteroidales bacterium]MBN2762253.1 hypothetical protein [Bacteroidales bacterium]